MANPEHLAILWQGVEHWNKWRKENPYLPPDLGEANLTWTDLTRADLSEGILYDADLSGVPMCNAKLLRANLCDARLTFADFSGADLRRANLSGADLRGANLSSADLSYADLSKADLKSATLCDANLTRAVFMDTYLGDADFSRARLAQTVFADVDFRKVRGLDVVHHSSASTIGIDTIRNSTHDFSPEYPWYSCPTFEFPEVFLRGCGLSDWEIENAKLYDSNLSASETTDIVYRIVRLRNKQPFEFYSCFIS
jgi:uncharacterized protein YjbI with pentapeptide repeats